MALNPQQQAFKEAYCKPGSPTFGNAYKSAKAVGINRMQIRHYVPEESLYFLYCPITNRVKIGKSSGGVKKRVGQISSISSVGDSYEVLFSMEDFSNGGEKEIHRMFAEYREHGEWFRVEGELKRFIDIILSEEDPNARIDEEQPGTQSVVLNYRKHKEYVTRQILG